ncbi:MAG: trypsin-like peptidase domain-containing protein [Chloroflexi bacterium]|nr:trypsin-like peptidase domain-containing protein [Chloroflexota bacterium]
MNNRKILIGITLLIMTSLACGFTFRPPSFIGNQEQSATAESEDSLPAAPTREGLASTAEAPRLVDEPTAGPTPTLVPDSERQRLDDEENVLVNIYQRVNPAVVYVAVSSNGNDGELEDVGTGSGFVIDKQGHIVTNNHVVASASQVDVSFADGTVARATIVGRDPYSDLAVIKVDVPEDKLVPVELGDSSDLHPGQKVIAIGNPYGLAGTMTTGIISAIGRTLPESGESTDQSSSFINPEIIQTDAAINPGNSGGPLLDSHGRVIGVNTAIRSTSMGVSGQPSNSGIGFAVPVNTVKRVAPALIADGTIRYPYLGITSRDELNLAEIADQLNVDVTQGVLVFEVVPNGPAARAGLRGGNAQRTISVRGAPVPLGGDIITAINGTPVKDYTALISILTATTKPGDTITLTILRNGEQQDIQLTVGERPR